jgi:hypothetical protein
MLALVLSGCATDYEWCPPGEAYLKNSQCRYGLSKSESVAAQEDWDRKARAEAERLSASYEDIVFAIYAPEGNQPGGSYCLQVFGAEPSENLFQRLRAAGDNPRKCSGKDVTHRYVEQISQQSENVFLAIVSYYCGPLCAAEHVVTVERDSHGAFRMTKEELLWIS